MNVRDCVEIDRVGEIDQIFDIPVGIRKTGMLILTRWSK